VRETQAPLGRSRELARLLELLAAARAGTGALVWLRGEAGIGKTCLAEAAMAAARERGITALAASADELERHQPFALIADCLRVRPDASDGRLAWVARLLGGDPVDSAPTPGERHGGGEIELDVSEALFGVLERVCARAPTMLLLDDLQWADESSLGFVGRLARRVADLPLLVVGTARPLPRRQDLERLMSASRARGARHIELGALDAETSEALVAAVAGGAPGANLRAQVAGCGGNPLFLRCLIEALEAERAIERIAGGEVEVTSASAPPSLAVVVLAWLSSLSADAVDVLRMTSLLGSGFSVADLSLLSGRCAASLWGALREGLHAGVLVDADDHLAFRHDVVREALYGDLPRCTSTSDGHWRRRARRRA
jgi:predicted ATPase